MSHHWLIRIDKVIEEAGSRRLMRHGELCGNVASLSTLCIRGGEMSCTKSCFPSSSGPSHHLAPSPFLHTAMLRG